MTDKTQPSIDGYRILRVIGHGGMSTVYLGEQASLERKVALKVMLAEALADEVSRARFENEARTIARLEHPNIVGIYEVGRTGDGLPFYSMPYLPRGHLAQRRLAGDQPKVAAILRSLLQALDYAHVRGVVHRDVKAENVLFDDADRPMLADFGIALRRGSNPRLTTAGLAVGSTAYMPPEQARGLDVDRRADLYSIGVLTWEMLVGRLPYSAGDALSMALKHVQEPVPRLPEPLRHWQGFLDRALAKDPKDRFASANEMQQALDALEQRSGRAFTPVEVPTESSVPAGPRRRGPLLLAGIGLALALGAGMGYVALRTPASDAGTDTAAAATGDATPLPAPAANAVTGLADPLAEGPSVAAFVANADQQLRTGALLAPKNANAWDSIEAAWRTNPTHPDTLRLTALLFDALANASERALLDGDLATARLAFERARQLDIRRGGTGASIVLLRKRLDAALDQRLTALLAKPATRPAAAALLADTSDWLGLDPARLRALQARVGTPANGGVSRAADTAAAPAAAEIVTITRADYAKFAAASGRAAAECGRGFFGRKLRWDNTGGDRRPVVCVSAADALAFAAWLGKQDGHRYRLPSVGELREPISRRFGGWLTLCADRSCAMRTVAGKSEPLDASRGYDDGGIQLVRSG